MAEPFLGQITLYATSFAPQGWIDCAGQILPISQYSALFSLLGVQYGGNGTTTFALPNLQGRTTVNAGSGPGLSTYDMGEETGVETVTLAPTEMAAHNHALQASANNGTVNTPEGKVLATVFSDGGGGIGEPTSQGNIYNPGAANTTLLPNSVAVAGNSQPHGNMQPYLVLRYCIALSGVYPSRP